MSYRWVPPDDHTPPPPKGTVCSGCGWHSLDHPRGCKYCDGDGSIILRASDRMQPTTVEDMSRMFPGGVYTLEWVEDGIGERPESFQGNELFVQRIRL